MFWFDFWPGPGALFLVEAVLVVAMLALPLRWKRGERALQNLARRRSAPLAAGALAILLRAAVLPVAPVPAPAIHDEFSYLLAADTFAHGRLTNPPHPLWQHFETFHEIQLPTYASMYPPLQGLVLGLGQAIAGIPFAGVLLSLGVMCAAICWALRGWFTPEWAFLGAVIAAIRIAMFSYWGNSYWGGALGAAGGALVFGALPRLIRSSRVADALMAALGLAILAATRPYEGLAFSIAIGFVALLRIRKIRLRVVLPPFCAAMVLAGALIGYYNWRVTDSPTTMPYSVNRQTYEVAPMFIFESQRPEPVYHNGPMREFYTGREVQAYEAGRTLRGFVVIGLNKVVSSWSFFAGPVLTLPLLAALRTWRSTRTRIFLFLAAAMMLAVAPVPYFVPHYISPVTILIYALLVQGMRSFVRGFPRAMRAIPLICVVLAGVRLALAAVSIPLSHDWPPTWERTWPGSSGRELIAAELQSKGGKHLVIVRRSHYTGGEYVYNDADIDNSPIVWARDMGAEGNSQLLQYYSSRKIWLLDQDSNAGLAPYPIP